MRRVNREKGTLVRDPMFRESLVQQPTVLLRLYQELAIEKEHMEGEQLTNLDARGGDLRACYGCGACSTGDYCSWCNARQLVVISSPSDGADISRMGCEV